MRVFLGMVAVGKDVKPPTPPLAPTSAKKTYRANPETTRNSNTRVLVRASPTIWTDAVHRRLLPSVRPRPRVVDSGEAVELQEACEERVA